MAFGLPLFSTQSPILGNTGGMFAPGRKRRFATQDQTFPGQTEPVTAAEAAQGEPKTSDTPVTTTPEEAPAEIKADPRPESYKNDYAWGISRFNTQNFGIPPAHEKQGYAEAQQPAVAEQRPQVEGVGYPSVYAPGPAEVPTQQANIPTKLPEGYVPSGRPSASEELDARRRDVERLRELENMEYETHKPSTLRKVLSGIAAVPLGNMTGLGPLGAYDLVAGGAQRAAAEPFTQARFRTQEQIPLLEKQIQLGTEETKAGAAMTSAGAAMTSAQASMDKNAIEMAKLNHPNMNVHVAGDDVIVTHPYSGDIVARYRGNKAMDVSPGSTVANVGPAGAKPLYTAPADVTKMDIDQQYAKAVVDANDADSVKHTGVPLEPTARARLMQDIVAKIPELKKIGTGQEEAGIMMAENTANSLYDSIQRVKPLINEMTAGFAGYGKYAPGTRARYAADEIANVKNQTKLYMIAALKSMTTNGSTGFGQLSGPENVSLENALGMLDQAATPDQVRRQLGIIEQTLLDFQNTSKAYRADREAQRQQIPGLAPQAPPSAPQGAPATAPQASPAAAPVAATQTSAALAAPQRGAVVDGWTFLGGDPASPKSWRR